MSLYVNPYWFAVSGGDPFFSDVSFLTEFNQHTVDESDVGATVYVIGGPTRNPVGVSSPGGAWTGERDAVGEAASVIDYTADYALSNADWTMEVFVLQNGISSDKQNIIARSDAPSDLSFALYYDNAGDSLVIEVSTNGTSYAGQAEFLMGAVNDGVTLAQFFDGNWHHVAAYRTGGVIYMAIDGLVGSGTYSIGVTAISDASACPLCVGSINANNTDRQISTQQWDGCLDEFRLTIGTSRYGSSDFTPPSVPLPRNGDDPDWADVKCLLGWDDYFTLWWDGNVPYSNLAQQAFIDGIETVDIEGLIKQPSLIGPYWTYDVNFNLLGEDFSLEIFDMKIRYSSASTQTFFGVGGSATGKAWRISSITGGLLLFQYSTDGSNWTNVTIVSGLVDTTVYTWDIAVCRENDDLHLYIDGAEVLSTTLSGSIYDFSATSTRCGFYANASNTEPASDDTRIKAVRLTKGVARYTGPSYTVPNLPLPLTS